MRQFATVGTEAGQVRRDLTPLVEKAEEAAQGGGDELDTSQAHPVPLADDESGDVLEREFIQSRSVYYQNTRTETCGLWEDS